MTEGLVHRLIESQAELTPDAVAVVWPDGTATFAELDQQAGRLARLLIELGVGPERLVGVSMEPSPLLLVTMLGIWKAGGVYLPIDPSLPHEVAEGMLADAGVRLLVGHGPIAVEQHDLDVLDLATLDLSNGPGPASAVAMVPANLAYCVFTSGSTGKPKLVAVAHESFANHGKALREQLSLGPDDRVLQSTPMAFDAALEEILPAWLAGGAVVMPAQRKFTSRELTDLIERLSITMVSLPSAYWHLWVDDLASQSVPLPRSLRTVFIGGDKILVDKLAAWYRLPGADRINWVSDYGPTETSISVALHHPARDGLGASDGSDYALVPLGRAFAGAALYILDAQLRPVPDGVPGDLWVGGPPVSRGYYGAPELTADRFRPDPLGRPGSRMYQTGDRAARLPDGMLSFLGRSDRQVKIRGQRVELGQVESALHNLAGVRDAVVVVVDDPPFGSYLVAYVEGAAELTEATIRAGLAERVPEAMLPRSITLLERIPRSALNGKVARAALPPIPSAPESGRMPDDGTTLERVVRWLIDDVLETPVRDRHEDFFAAGGDSLRGMQVLNRVAEVTGVSLTFEQLRGTSHVAGIAALIRQHRSADARPDPFQIVPERHSGDRRPATRGQQALWFLDQVHRGAPVYSIPVCYRVRGPLELQRLDAALSRLVARHEALRTVLRVQDGAVRQHVGQPEPIRTTVVRAADFADADRQARSAAQEPFDLAGGPLLRSTCFQLDGEWLWLLNVHHAVFDAWSLAVFWREFTALYQGRTLPDVAVQYSDYAAWQERWLSGPSAATQRAYWQRQLSDLPIAHHLGGNPAGGRVGTEGFALRCPPGTLEARAVEALARECRSTSFVVLLAGLLVRLRGATGADDLAVGVPVACRNQPGTENIIGYLVNTVVVRVVLSGAMTFREVIARTDTVLAEALTNQELPFADAVGAVSRSGRGGQNPLFQAMFAFQSTPLDSLDGIPGLQIAEHFVHSGTARTPLTWTARYDAAGLVGEVEFAADHFDRPAAEGWLAELMSTIDRAISDPDAEIGDAVRTGRDLDASSTGGR